MFKLKKKKRKFLSTVEMIEPIVVNLPDFFSKQYENLSNYVKYCKKYHESIKVSANNFFEKKFKTGGCLFIIFSLITYFVIIFFFSGVDHDSYQSIESNTEQDSEYTEKYASLRATIWKIPVKEDENEINAVGCNGNHIEENGKSVIKINEKYTREINDNQMRENNENSTRENKGNYTSESNRSHTKENKELKEESEENHFEGIFSNYLIYQQFFLFLQSFEFTGSYSKKEKEKWKHPVEMPNNPYSPENIQRRLSTNSIKSLPP